MSKRLSHDDYTVGCICPMGVELAPVLAMLDERHDFLPTDRDENAYCLGSINGHNLVVAVMPEIGNNAAATVATQLINDFPSIRFCLLVGIGAGVPGENGQDDVRLGDVVVSQPKGAFGGLVQYDLGKRKPDGTFERRGQLNKPPPVLNANVRKLEAHHIIFGNDILVHVSKMLQTFPKMQPRYSFPGSEHDCLFEASYPHQGGPDCQSCNHDRVIDRVVFPDRGPQVHHGVIGSANTVLTDPLARDQLRRDTGVLCVEMEAAGVTNNFPCLVIRGICDYADSHKNDKWQPFAAAAAAAYMKELLTAMPTSQVSQTLKVNEIIAKDVRTHELLESAFHIQESILQNSQQQVLKREVQYQDEQQMKCHRSFKTSMYEHHKNRNPVRAHGTCQWLLTDPQFQTWKTDVNCNLLWVSADPGCGKSVLARALIDQDLQSASRATVCYFFFKDNGAQDRLEVALSAILHQLFSAQPQLIHHAVPEWKHSGDHLNNDTLAMWRILKAAASDSAAGPIYCVLDALDECRDKDAHQLVNLLSEFHVEAWSGEAWRCLKFLATSRPYNSIRQDFASITSEFPQVHLHGEDQNEKLASEVSIVIENNINGLAREFDLSPRSVDRLRSALSLSDQRTYLWLHLAIREVRDAYNLSPNPDEVEIRSLPNSVEDAYERILNKVHPTQKHLVKTVLLIIIGARRPLTVAEMAIALGMAMAGHAHESALTMYSATQLEKQIRQWCGLFVFVSNQRLFLIHQTAKEFLLCDSAPVMELQNLWKASLTSEEIERQMAYICIEYIHAIGTESVSASKTFRQTYERLDYMMAFNRFHYYCKLYWRSHLAGQNFQFNTELFAQLIALFDRQPGLIFAGGLRQNRMEMWEAFPSGTPLHIAAVCGSVETLRHLLVQQGFDIEVEDGHGQTALFWAAIGANFAAMEFLLSMGANPNNQSRRTTRTVLAEVIKLWDLTDIDMAKVLIRAGADVHIKDSSGATALHWLMASTLPTGAKQATLELLIEAGADVNVMDASHRTPTLWAAERDPDAFAMLIEGGANVDLPDAHGTTPLQLVLVNEHRYGAKILIDAGAAVNAARGKYGTALHIAAAQHTVDIVEDLLRRGADPTIECPYYVWQDCSTRHGTALSAMAGNVPSEQLSIEPILRAAMAGYEFKRMAMQNGTSFWS